MSRIGRRLAFDYGEVRIGVAVCDQDGILASPVLTLLTRDPQLMRAIAELINEYEPVKIYIGLPLNLSGAAGVAVEKARKFGSRIESNYIIPVVYIDERLSTVSATKAQQSAGIPAKAGRKTIDQMAAVAILEQGLANER